jgi:hypothetical protein
MRIYHAIDVENVSKSSVFALREFLVCYSGRNMAIELLLRIAYFEINVLLKKLLNKLACCESRRFTRKSQTAFTVRSPGSSVHGMKR